MCKYAVWAATNTLQNYLLKVWKKVKHFFIVKKNIILSLIYLFINCPANKIFWRVIIYFPFLTIPKYPPCSHPHSYQQTYTYIHLKTQVPTPASKLCLSLPVYKFDFLIRYLIFNFLYLLGHKSFFRSTMGQVAGIVMRTSCCKLLSGNDSSSVFILWGNWFKWWWWILFMSSPRSKWWFLLVEVAN